MAGRFKAVESALRALSPSRGECHLEPAVLRSYVGYSMRRGVIAGAANTAMHADGVGGVSVSAEQE